MRLRRQAGFTTVEMLVAVLLLVGGILTLAAVLNVSRGLTSVAERQTTMAHRARGELERIAALPYAQIALTAAPAGSSDPNSPAYYVSPGPPPAFQWDRRAAGTEPLVIDGANGALSSSPVAWSDGRLSGQIYEYVTWRTDPGCGAGCPAANNLKRVTVAITIAGSAAPRKPVLVSTLVADPNAAPAGYVSNGVQNPLQSPQTSCQNALGQTVACTAGIGQGNATTWFPYDTPATQSSEQTIVAAHATHPTVAPFGVCSALVTTGCPVPDLMGTAPTPAGTPIQPVYNLSTDQCASGCAPPPGGGATGCTGAYCGGRALPPDVSCSATPSATDNSHGELWSSPQLTQATTLTGDGGMTLYTQTLGGVSASVTLCVAIYDVPPSITNLVSVPPVALGVSSYTSAQWPTSPTPVSFVFNFRGSQAAVAVAAGDRIGVRIWVAAGSQAGIAAIYDHPNFQSQFQLNTR